MIHYFLKTRNFIPNEFHHSVFDIDFNRLYQEGFRYIISDLDNTLISYEETLPTTQIREMVQTLKTMGFIVVLVSNNHSQRLEKFCETLDIDGFANAKKPLLFGLKKAFNSFTNAQHGQTLIIGDQLMTDIWGANRFSCYSILVNPLKKKTEKWYTKFNRQMEEKMLTKIKRKYPEKYRNLRLDKRI